MSYSDNSSFSTTTSYQTMVKAREVALFYSDSFDQYRTEPGIPTASLATSLLPGTFIISGAYFGP